MWVQKVCKFLCNNFDDFSSNTYASHLLRTAIQCVTGVRLEEKNKSKQTEGYSTMSNYQFEGETC